MRKSNRVVAAAISLSDIHLWHVAPACRRDDDWFLAMMRPLFQVSKLAHKHKCPIICNGDIFDRPSATPEMINWALEYLPQMISIPGQHDLPYHNYDDMGKSAYWTLVKANKITHLSPGTPYTLNDHITLYGFPWGFDVTPPNKPLLTGFNVAVIHSYIWTKQCSYPSAPPEKHLHKWRKKLKGYRVACFGDNHKGFISKDNDCTILNTGTLIRRKWDEREYEPRVGVIWSDGSVTRHKLDTRHDILVNPLNVVVDAAERMGGLENFLDSIRDLKHSSADFMESVLRAADDCKLTGRTRELLLEVMGT